MKRLLLSFVAGAASTTAFALTAAAAPAPYSAASVGLHAYPTARQSAGRQSSDERECYEWAQQTTGTDPARLAAEQPPPSAPPQTGARTGAARGAAGGAVIGRMTGSARSGAAVGATAGAVAGRRNADQQQAAAAQSQQAQSEMDGFRRALTACLEGRQYSVQ